MSDEMQYEICNGTTIRDAVAQFIDNSPLLTHFKDEKYYELEDSIIDLIKNIKNTFYNESYKSRNVKEVLTRSNMRTFDHLLTLSEEEQNEIWHYFCVSNDETCNGLCGNCRMRWLASEYTEPKRYTADEIALAKMISDEYKWIVRDETGCLCVHANKPRKSNTRRFWGVVDTDGAYSELRAFEKMFQSVKWEDDEPTSLDFLRSL